MLISPLDLIKGMFQVYRQHWTSMLRYIGLLFALLLVFGILFVAGLFIIVGSVSSGNPESLRGLFGAISGSLLVFLIVLFAAFTIANTWLQVGFVRTTSRAVLNQEKMGLGAELKQSRPFVWRTLGSGLLVGLIAGLPILLVLVAFAALRFSGFAIPGVTALLSFLGIYSVLHVIYFAIVFSFSSTGIAVDGWGIKESLQKSKEFVKGKWWAIVGRFICVGLVLMVPYYIFLGLGSMQNAVGAFFSLVGMVYYIGFLIPMAMIPSVMLYHNFKGDLPAHHHTSHQK